jgi:hypothetical protein
MLLSVAPRHMLEPEMVVEMQVEQSAIHVEQDGFDLIPVEHSSVLSAKGDVLSPEPKQLNTQD